jgi:hypothetical protein
MAIPSLTADGLLPVGVHDATLEEVEQAFGLRTERRVELFQKLTLFLEFARTFGVFEAIIVDGSFVTDKDSPGDIDAVILLARANLPRLLAQPGGAQFLDQDAIKPRYEIHLFLDPPPSGTWTSFFQKLKPADALARKLRPGARRGVLKVTL